MDSANLVRTKQCRYPPAKQEFINHEVKKLQKYGFIKTTTNAEWVSAPLIVRKPPPANFRMTIDLCGVNSSLKPMTWTMPSLETQTGNVRERRFFASIDFPTSFWQLPINILSQALHAFMTDSGIFMPTRTVQGGSNSAQNFQGKVGPCFGELDYRLKYWINDFALRTQTEQELLNAVRRLLQICRERDVKVSVGKSDLMLTKLKCCGRIISEKSLRYDPQNASGLQNCASPINAGELRNYVHCIVWMQKGNPDHARGAAPLRELLEVAYKKTGKRIKRSIKGHPSEEYRVELNTRECLP